MDPTRLGPNLGFVDEQYRRFLADPDSVSAAWREFFSDYRPLGDRPAAVPAALPPPATVPASAPAASPQPAPDGDGTGTPLTPSSRWTPMTDPASGDAVWSNSVTTSTASADSAGRAVIVTEPRTVAVAATTWTAGSSSAVNNPSVASTASIANATLRAVKRSTFWRSILR